MCNCLGQYAIRALEKLVDRRVFIDGKAQGNRTIETFDA